MNSRISVFSPFGDAIGEFSRIPVFRTWVINKPGEAEFEIATNDIKATPGMLNFGNLLHITHESLPNWTGFIDVPREWNPHTIKVKAYSAETVMDWRYTPFLINLGMLPCDEYFRQALQYTNNFYNAGIPINLGEASSKATVVHIQGIRFSTMLEKVNNRTGTEWNVTGRIENGKLRLYLNLYDYMGQKTFQILDNSNVETATPIITENGPIYNHVTVYSQADSGGARKYATSIDEESIAKYGLRVTAEEQKGGGTDEAGLQIAADYLLMQYKEPHSKIAPTVLNVASTFQNIRVGNIARWKTSTAGFNPGGTGMLVDARVLGMEYDESQDKVTLVADVDYANITKKQFLAQWRDEHGRRI